MPKVQAPKTKRPVLTTIIILVILFFVSMLFAAFIGMMALVSDAPVNGNVAVIAVKGTILADGGGSIFDESYASSTTITDLLKDANEDPQFKAVVIEINSPGGSPVASEEIAAMIKKMDKPTVSWVREVGASGGYWVASAADHVVASKMSVTGSIGVIGSYLEFSGTLERYNASYQRLVAGKYKDAGSPFRKLLSEEESILQSKLDRLHQIFIEEVATNRNLSVEHVRQYADGMFLLGEEAYNAGLIDELGGRAEVTAYLETNLNTTVEFAFLKQRATFADLFTSVWSQHGYALGQGLAHGMQKPQLPILT